MGSPRPSTPVAATPSPGRGSWSPIRDRGCASGRPRSGDAATARMDAARRDVAGPASTRTHDQEHHVSVIEVEGLRKRYGDTVAVADVSLTVEAGEIFGILGPNGAGKTTTVECLVGLRRPDAGGSGCSASIRDGTARGSRQRVGVQLQESRLPDALRVGEASSCTRRSTTTPPTPTSCCATSDWPRRRRPRSRTSPAGSSSGCRSRSRSSATPRSRCSTSSRPDSTHERAATRGTSSSRSGRPGSPSCS